MSVVLKELRSQMMSETDFISLFESGEYVVTPTEMRNIYDALIRSEAFDWKKPKHDNFFLEFEPLLNVVEYIGSVKSVLYTWLTNAPFDARIILKNDRSVLVDCTSALDNEKYALIRETYSYLMDTYKSFNMLGPVRVSGTRRNRQCEPYQEMIQENYLYMKLLSLLSGRITSKYEKYILSNDTPVVDWLILPFENHYFHRDTLLSIVSSVNTVARELCWSRLFYVGMIDTIVIDSATLCELH